MTYDVVIPDPLAKAYDAGTVKLMTTKAGLSTTLVDTNHDIVGSAGLIEHPDVSATTDVLATRGSGAVVVAVAVAAVVSLAAGTWYFLHRRKKAKATTEATHDNQQGAGTVLDEAEAVVDAELARLHPTVPHREAARK